MRPAWGRPRGAAPLRDGPPGFTLIELLIVLVIIGIVATIAIPKFANSKEKSYLAAMKSDLRNLMTAQEGYYLENATYSNNLPALIIETPGVSVLLQDVSGTGWGATASHTGTGKKCAVFYGLNQPAVPPATQEGVVACN